MFSTKINFHLYRALGFLLLMLAGLEGYAAIGSAANTLEEAVVAESKNYLYEVAETAKPAPTTVATIIPPSPLNQGLVPDSIEHAALVAFYNSTNGDSWTNKTNWLQGTTAAHFSTWFGVNVSNGDVIGLLLNSNGLSGTLPVEIGNLTALREIRIFANTIGGEIPESLGNLQGLRLLKFQNNRFTGNLPASIGNLKLLLEIFGYSNRFDKPLPEEIGGLSGVSALELYGNAIPGPIPESISSMANLQVLTLSNNQLSGNIPPGLGNLKKLRNAVFQSNQLSGTIPESLGGMTSLQILDFRENRLEGALPDTFAHLAGLTYLRFSSNRLTALPDFSTFANKANLHLYVERNYLDFKELEKTLDASGQLLIRFIGDYPQHSSLETTYFIKGSAATMSFEPEGKYISHYAWTSPTNTPHFDDGNTATVWANYAQTGVKLQCYAYHQKFGFISRIFTLQEEVGTIPDKVEYAALKALYDSTNGAGWTNNANWLQGTTSADFAKWHGVTVQNGDVYSIDLPGNNVSGKIPEQLKDCKGLYAIKLPDNAVTALPLTIGGLTKLGYLVLSNNQLSSIPDSIGSLVNLRVLDLNQNVLEILPESLGNLKNLRQLFLHNNHIKSLSETVGNLLNLELLNLNSNQLKSLPTNIGNLTKLKTLNIFNNQITTLPESIQNLIALESFTGTYNRLKALPEGIWNLSAVKYFNVDHNQLSNLPDGLENLTALTTLTISNNTLEMLPDFSTLPNSANLILSTSGNFLTFYEIEKNVDEQGVPFVKKFTYNKQNIKLDSVKVKSGVADTLVFDAGAKQVTYIWQKQTVTGGWENIVGKTSNNLFLSALEVVEVVEGVRYRCVATSGFLNFSITKEFILKEDYAEVVNLIVNSKAYANKTGYGLIIKKDDWSEEVEVGGEVNLQVPRTSIDPMPTYIATLTAPGAKNIDVHFTINAQDSIEGIKLMVNNHLTAASPAYFKGEGKKLIFFQDRKQRPEIHVKAQLDQGLVYRPVVLRQGIEERRSFELLGIENVEGYKLEIYRIKDGALIFQSQDKAAKWDGSTALAGAYKYAVYNQNIAVAEGQFLLRK